MVVPESQPIAIPSTHRPAIAVFGTALGASAVGALLVPLETLGLGFSLALVAIFGLSLWLRRHGHSGVHAAATWLWIPVLSFALLISWRDSPDLRLLNLLMLIVFGGILAIRARPSSIAKGSVYDYPGRAIGAWFVAIVDGIALLATDIAWRALPQNAHGKQAAGIVRGLLLATPLLLAFGFLFANADSSFERLFTGITIDAPTVVEQGFVAIVFGWCTAGFFRRLYISQAPAESAPKPVAVGSNLGATELAVILGSINVLFALFVATQAKHFFGGLDVVRTTSGMGVADFARRGFFELVAVTALVLPMLLGLHAISDPQSIKAKWIYKVMSICLIALLSVVMLSASLKMKLYMEAFSLSTLRVYVGAALAWFGAVYVWFASTTLRERANRFAWGAMVLLGSFVVALNVLNPDRFVSEWNVSRSSNVDWDYLTSLSDDASPVIYREWSRIPQQQREIWSGNRDSRFDWRSSNLSQLQSRRVATPATKPREVR